MQNQHGIYVTDLRKGISAFGVKIGVSRTPEVRAYARNQKAFDYAWPHGEAYIRYGSKELLKKLERLIKKEFRLFRVETANRTQEIFCPHLRDNVVWAVRRSLSSPMRCHELIWRAANSILSLSDKPEVELLRFSMTNCEPCPGSQITYQINRMLKQRFIPHEFCCSRLDAGYATDITVTESPNDIRITYLFNFSIDPSSCLESPCWSIRNLNDVCFIPSEWLDIEKARSRLIRAPGFNNFTVKFTEIINKKTGGQTTTVSSVSGKHLDEEVENELLEASFCETDAMR